MRPSWLARIEIVPNEYMPTPCWFWQGARTVDGYGQVKIQGQVHYLHRFAWECHNDELLGKERDGHHQCYNRSCFNPLHIEPLSREANRSPTWAKHKSPVSDEELVALYDLNGYFYQLHGYVLATTVPVPTGRN